MILIKGASGQLANKLHFLAYFLANQKEYNYALIITCLPEFYDYFLSENLSAPNPIILRRGIIRTFLNKLLNKCQSISHRFDVKLPGLYFHEIPVLPKGLVDYDIAGRDFIDLIRGNILLPQGWHYRDYVNLQKHTDYVKQIFKPKPFFLQQIENELKLAHGIGNTVIGVHIRRSDYKEFNGGRWFYDDSVYLAIMKQAAALFDSAGCVFVICSDEVVEPHSFNELKVLIRVRPAIVDLYLLASCDYILGPPSTFSSWASFYNFVPLCSIMTPDQQLKRESFQNFFTN